MQNVKTTTSARKVDQENYSNFGKRWYWGFAPSAEVWNGRLAMIGFLSVILIELLTGQGVLHFWQLLSL